MLNRRPRLVPRLVPLAILVAALAATGAAAQEPVLLERIVAIVDEEMILQSDLDLAIELYQLDRQLAGSEPEPVTPELTRKVLDSLIENKLVIAAAKQNDMVVEEADIDARVNERVEQLVGQYGGQAGLEQALHESGLTLEDFRFRYASQLRNQQYMRLVVGRFIRPGIEVMENEVKQYYLDHLSEMPAEPDSITVASIMVRVQPSPETRRLVQDRVARAQQALASGRAFADVARELSQGPNAQRGGRIGAVKPGDLFDRVLNQAVAELPVGQVSQPIVSSRGVHLLLVEADNPDGSKLLSQIFFPVEVTDADIAAARDRIAAARARVEAGEAFSLVAAEVSEDPVSAASGGLMGTFQLDQLAPAFQEALTGLGAGQLSEPLLTAAGWYVFQVIERTSGHQYTYEELAGELRQYVEGQKIEVALAEYVDGLRERFFVDIKP
ncbi:MAG: peptidylprolyl isomerase [Candidatus Krumholzibacteriia bacterium]